MSRSLNAGIAFFRIATDFALDTLLSGSFAVVFPP
jgi:hypothetical protein